MIKKTILVVEDEKPLGKALKYALERENYGVVVAEDGLEGLAAFERERPDFLILDVMLPALNGFEVCARVRRESRVPILMLTARKDEVDRVLGLELGADDYVTKPFSLREVCARVRSILQRVEERPAPRTDCALRAGGIELDAERYSVRVRGRAVAFGAKEFALLKALLEAGGRALTRESLLETVWGHDRALGLETRTVDQHVKRLRRKLGPESGRIVTVKTIGYRIHAE
ncbi:MAG TPA: response regulator transcription factor [Elusimicrobiota bacterium]|nr:response regulator transcription factor [Elusimicrobiota bacterium]